MHQMATANRGEPGSGARRSGALALALQEPFTAVARLRTQRQVTPDSQAFRTHLKNLLSRADATARADGYAAESVRLAIYAVVAFVDESVLNSSLPAFADWARRPLQEEVFGEHMAGEVFFDNLDSLLVRQDSEELADVLEVYQLCLLLGFQGRYGGSRSGQVAALRQSISDKIIRVRGTGGELAPDWALPADEAIPVRRDPWVRRLVLIFLGTVIFAGLLWALFALSLRSGARLG